MKIIALKGKNGSGKSTVSAMLSKKLDEKGVSNKVLSFAKPAKTSYENFLGYKVNWEDRVEKEKHREGLEKWCKAIKSAFSFNVFAEEVLLNIDKEIKELNIQNFILSDLRFEDEYKAMQNKIPIWSKLIIIEIKNPLTDNNPPEYDLDKIPSDIIVNFDGDLELSIEKLLVEILKD